MGYGFVPTPKRKKRRKPKPAGVTSVAAAVGAKGEPATKKPATAPAPKTPKVFKKSPAPFDQPSDVTKTSKVARRERKEEKAKAYERSQTAKILERASKKDEEGEPVTKEVTVPKSRVDAKRAERHMDDAERRYERRIENVQDRAERRVARADTRPELREVQRDYRLGTRQATRRLREDAGAIQDRYFETSDQVVIPERDRPRVEKRLERVERRADRLSKVGEERGALRFRDLREAEQRDAQAFQEAREERREAREDARTTTPLEAVGGAVGDVTGPVGEAVSDVYGFARETLEPSTAIQDEPSPIERVGEYVRKVRGLGKDLKTQRMMTAGGPDADVAKPFTVNPETGLLRIVETLAAPKQAALAGVGKLTGVKGEKAGPLEALTTEAESTRVTTGGEVAESVGLPKWTGLAFELGLDPLMFAGAGTVMPARAALTRGAKLEAALAKTAPDELADDAIQGLRNDVFQTGTNVERWADELAARASKRGVRPAHRRSKGTRGVLNEFDTLYTAKIAKALEDAPTAKLHGTKEELKLPTYAMEEATQDALRAGQMRQVVPGVRLAIGNPLRPIDRQWATADLKLKGGFARVPFIPATKSIRERLPLTAEGRKPSWVTWEEYAEAASRRRVSREAHRISHSQRIALDRTNQRWIQRAILPITHQMIGENAVVPSLRQMIDQSEDSLDKVGRWMQVRQIKGSGKLADEWMQHDPLTDAERQVAENIDSVLGAYADAGIDMGYLRMTLDNYFPNQWVEQATHYRVHVDPDAVQGTMVAPGSTPGSQFPGAMHRKAATPEEFWGEDMLEQVARASGHPNPRAAASDLWELSPRRALLEEGVLRPLERGQRLRLEDLPGEIQRVVLNEVKRGDESLLRDPELNDGYLRLADEKRLGELSGRVPEPERPGALPFREQPFAGLRPEQEVEARLYSIEDDLNKMRGVLREREAADVDDGISQALRDSIVRVERERDDLMGQRGVARPDPFGPRSPEDYGLQPGGPHTDVPRPRGLKAIDDEITFLKNNMDMADRRLMEATEAGDEAWVVQLGENMQRLDSRLTELQAERAAIEAARPEAKIVDLEENGNALREQARLLERKVNEIGERGLRDDEDIEQISSVYDDVWEQMDENDAAREQLMRDMQTVDDEALRTAERPTDYGIPPIEPPGLPPGSQLRDPLDYQGRLSDQRVKGMSPVLNPAEVVFYRTRQDAVRASMVARWRAIDDAVGIPVSSAKQRGIVKREGLYRDAEGREWVDVAAEAHKNGVAGGVAQAMEKAGRGRRLWPTHALQDATLESMRLGEGTHKAIFEAGVDNFMNRFMSMVRYGATVPFPPYHFRNMISDAILSTQAGGAGFAFHPFMTMRLAGFSIGHGKLTGKARQFLGAKIAGDGKIQLPHSDVSMDPQDFLLMTDLFGIRSGLHLSEFMRVVRTGRYGGLRPHERVGRLGMIGPSGAIGKRMLELGARREDMFRFLTFYQRLRTNGGDAGDAAWYTIRHHFDYDDLTQGEKKWARAVFFFYTWYRKNIPLQFAELINRPGFFSGLSSTYHSLKRGETPINQDWSRIVPWAPDMSGPVPRRLEATFPDYMKNPLSAVSVKWNDHAAQFAFGAPWADMNLVGNLLSVQDKETWVSGVRQGTLLLNPVLGLAITSLGQQQDPLTGRSLDNYEPVPGFVGDVAEWMGMDVQRDKYGRPYVDNNIVSFLRNMPIFGRGAGYFTPRGSPSGDTGFMTEGKLLPQTLGLTSRVSLGPDRIREAWSQMWAGKKAEMTDASFRTPSDFSSALKIELKKDRVREILEWAVDREIPYEWLEQNAIGLTGVYVPTDEREKTKSGDALGALDLGADALGSATKDLDLSLDGGKEDKPTPTYEPGSKFARQMRRHYNELLARKREESIPTVLEPIKEGPKETQRRVQSYDGDEFVGTKDLGGGRGPTFAMYREGGHEVETPRGKATTSGKDPDRFKHRGKKETSWEDKVPAWVPPQYRKAIFRNGKLVDPAVKAAGLDMSGAEYLAATIDFETGGTWDPGIQNGSSGAFGLGQFMEGTADSFRSEYGVETRDPSKPRQQIKGAAMHLSGKYGHPALYDGYNPGYGADPIPGRLAEKGGATKAGRQPLTTTELFHDPGVNLVDNAPTSAIGGHGSHVHFGSEDPQSMLVAVRIAQKMGLTVDENPMFADDGNVDPSAHTTGSHHYQEQPLPKRLQTKAKKLGGTGKVIGEAIDVTGDAGTLLAYNKRLAQMSGGTAVSPSTTGSGYGVAGESTSPAYGLGTGTQEGSQTFGLPPLSDSLRQVFGPEDPNEPAPLQPGTPAPAQAPQRFGPLPGYGIVDETQQRLAEIYGLRPAA